MKKFTGSLMDDKQVYYSKGKKVTGFLLNFHAFIQVH